MPRQRGKRRPTMDDVAALAGVSQTTVSFVLSGTAQVTIPEETRNRVHEAVKHLGYRPNAAAKVLVTKKSNFIGFITDEVATTPFAGGIIKAAQDAAWAHGKLLLIVNSERKPSIEEAAIEMMLEHQVGGIVYAAMYHHSVELPANIREVPAVLVNCFTPDCSLPSVVPDEVAGGRDATEYLIARGHKRIAFINIGPVESKLPAVTGRLEGYKQALAAHGLSFDESLIRHGDGVAEDGHRCTVELMKQKHAPTAIFCGNDRTAMGAYDALKELGLRIPDDVAVIGFDNQEIISEYLRPPLTTMALPFYEMGKRAVEWLEAREIREANWPDQQLIECPMIERASA